MIKQYRTGVKIMPNILIVEDDININNLLCEVLRKAGYTCEQAFSGGKAASGYKRKGLYACTA